MYICDYNHFVDNIVTQLSLANTTTAVYPLSADLTKSVKDVVRIDPGIQPEFIANYPRVSVRLLDRREYQTAITGSNFNRDIFLDLRIDAFYDDFLLSDVNLNSLLSNIEANLRYNKNIWNYNYLGFKTIYVLPREIRFKNKYQGGVDTFNTSGEIRVEVKGNLKSI